MALGVSSSNVNGAGSHLFLSSNQNVVPLCELSISDLLVDLALRSVDSTLETLLVEVLVNGLTVISCLLRDWQNDHLSG